MKGHTHILFGLLLSFVLLEVFSYDNPLLLVLLVLFASLLPDIDERHSRFGRKVPLIGVLFRHRGFFHGILFLVFCVIMLSLWLSPLYVIAFTLGFLGHILLDAITPAGVRIFWPSTLKLKGFVRVGGVLEKLLFFCFFIVFVWLLLG